MHKYSCISKSKVEVVMLRWYMCVYSCSKSSGSLIVIVVVIVVSPVVPVIVVVRRSIF